MSARASSHAPPEPATAPADITLAAALIAHLGDAVLAVGADGSILAANASAARLFGRTVAELVGSSFPQLVIPSDRSTVAAAERQAREGKPQRYEAYLATRDGEERIVAISSAPLPGTAAPGGANASVLTLRDVSAERRASQELARSEARYRHLFEGASDAIMTFDAIGRFTTVNDAGEVISGYKRDELIGRFFGPLLALEALPRAIMEFGRALAGSPGQFETVLVRKDGQRRFITVTYSCPQRSREVLCLIRDATEEKQLQQQLIQSEKMAAIGQLVSGVAHELNNPLASISAFAQLLLASRVLSPDQRHSAEVIANESRRAARIVHNLLTFARQHKAEKVYADINKVVEDTLELRAYELNVRGIRVAREYGEPAPTTMADVYQLQQVILNLVTNAVQAMAEVERAHHRLTVRTRARADVVRIEIEDTGPGIPATSLDLVFNPFYTTKPTGKGTGLGLSISLGIVSEHGGRIWAENVPGGGCRFCVELPRVATEQPNSPTLLTAPTTARPGLRILVADDELPIRMALERFLSAEGHTVTTVGSGGEVLSRAAAGEVYDVVLLDMRMPDVSGKQIFERWQQGGVELANRVAFLTGDIVSADLQSFLEATGRPYLPKPFELDAILRILPQAPLG